MTQRSIEESEPGPHVLPPDRRAVSAPRLLAPALQVPSSGQGFLDRTVMTHLLSRLDQRPARHTPLPAARIVAQVAVQRFSLEAGGLWQLPGGAGAAQLIDRIGTLTRAAEQAMAAAVDEWRRACQPQLQTRAVQVAVDGRTIIVAPCMREGSSHHLLLLDGVRQLSDEDLSLMSDMAALVGVMTP